VVEVTWENVAALILVFLAIVVVFGIAIWMTSGVQRTSDSNAAQTGILRSAAATGGSILLLLLVGNPVVYGQLGGKAREFISDMTVNRLSDQEAALLVRGYYEDLVGVGRFNSQLWEIYTKRPSDWPNIMETDAARYTGDNLIVELVPSTTINFQGATLSTNRWGMRDRDYQKIPPPGTYRIALTGPSFVMGSGVADDEVFEWLLEDRLNQENDGSQYARYEILNFAVAGYSAIQNLMVLEQKGLAFQPNTLFFVAHQHEEASAALYLADRISAGADLPYGDLIELARRAGVEAGGTREETERRLKPIQSEILSWTYRRIVAVSRAHDILPVWIFMPTLEDPVREEDVAQLAQLAEDSGFIVLNLADAYENQDVDSLVVAYWDRHPNATGHRLIAERLYQALREKGGEIPLIP
jgi:hypothetical protein